MTHNSVVPRKKFKRNVLGMLESIIDEQPGQGSVLASSSTHSDLKDMLRYVALNPGNLWRPLLLRSVANTYNDVPYVQIVYYSALVELVHATSLALDDLPFMDNASLRRGKPACHIEFGESSGISSDPGTCKTILMGLSAFDYVEACVRHGMRASKERRTTLEQNVRIGDEFTRAKLCLEGGQYIDLFKTEGIKSLADFAGFYGLKTGALCGAAMAIGGILGGETSEGIDKLRASGENLGIAYQFADDLIDRAGNEELAGKTIGLDSRRKNIFSVVKSAQEILEAKEEFVESARASLDCINGKKFSGTKRLISEMDRAFSLKIDPSKLQDP